MEGRGVEFHRIFLDHDGIAYVAHHGRLKVVFVNLKADDSHIRFPVTEVPLLHVGLVAHHLHMEDIVSKGNFLQLGFTFVVCKGEIGDCGVFGGNNIYGCKAHRLIGKGVQDGGLYRSHTLLEQIVIDDDNLRLSGKTKAQA